MSQAYARWWSGLSISQKILPAILVLNYWLALWLLQGFRSDHLTIGIVVLALSYLGPHAHTLRAFLMPFILTVTIYDSQRFYSDYIRGPVHVGFPYDFDKRFFGIQTEAGLLTPNEWWQKHIHPALDVVTGFAYLVFVFEFIGVAAFFRFWLPRYASTPEAAHRAREKAQAMAWTFFFLNMIGYSTYYWFAAAPPWYVSTYGLGPANMAAQASSAGCVRFDQILGTRFFSEMYGRSADVFGAIPSLHVAYPLVASMFAFQFGRLRAFNVAFYCLMCFSAVYLNHHYVIDLLWGSAYAVVITLLVNRYYDWKLAAARPVVA